MAKKPLKITVGCDPEVFMCNPNTGAYVSAHGMIPGTKFEPYKVRNGAVQVDGNALEFNTDPASTGDEFVRNVQDVFDQMKAMVPGYNVLIEPTVVFEKGYFDSLPSEAKEVGCMPDFNAYTGTENPIPKANDPYMRAAGGHIHVGWVDDVDPFDPNHFEDCRDVVKQLDHYLGMPSLCWDKDSKRRELYGKAGAFRPKPYGVEYRTLSNAWLKDPRLIRWVYNTTITAVNDLYTKTVNAEANWGVGSAATVINQNQSWWDKTRGWALPVPVPPVGSFDPIPQKKKRS